MAELQRRHGSEPLFEVVFNYTHFHVYGELSGEEQSRVQGRAGHVATEFALAVNFLVPPGSGELVLSVEGARRIFDGPRVAELRALYVRILEAMAAEPASAHDAAALVDDAGTAWSQGPVVPVPTNDLAALFAEQAARMPGGVAVRQGGHTLSRAELDAQSDRLAQELSLRGVGLDSVVGIFVEPSRDAVVSVLAVLKAGGAYLPIDPSYPAERIAYMLQDSGACLVLTETALASRLGDAVETLCLDALPARVSTHPAVRPSVSVRPDHLAYVIYTSGSTGRPKGTGLTHAGVVSVITVQQEALPLGSDDALLQFASLGFDGFVWELWSALLNGATLVVPTREERLDPEAFAALVAREHVTCALLPPSLLAELDPAAVPGLAKLMVAGEACAPSQAERWARGRRLYNAYGPTEITMYATLQELRPPLHGRVPLGRPIGNARVHVLDAALSPAPTGTPGELCIGGAGVARGYLGRAGLTAERFVPDPFGGSRSAALPHGRPGPLPARRRRSSSWAASTTRSRSAASASSWARSKRRSRAPAGVHEAVVVVRGQGAERRLVAYVVGDESRDSLRDALRQSLPEYMVPTAFVTLAALPLTANGKVDRRALPLPEGETTAHPVIRRARDAHRGSARADLVRPCSASRGWDGTIDFFDLGGHSLLATQIVSRIRRDFGVELPLRTLFEAPSAGRSRRRRRPGPPPDGRRRGHGGRSRRRALLRSPPSRSSASGSSTSSPRERRLQHPRGSGACTALWTFRPWQRALARIVERHSTLRSRFLLTEGRPRRSCASMPTSVRRSPSRT